MIKYNIKYKSVAEVDFTCEISNDTYLGSEIELEGSCNIESASADEAYNPLWGKSLSIAVLATVTQPLSDLWQDDEYFWYVVFKKAGQVKFVGYLSGEGVFESYNTDKWDLNLTAVGPIGVISDLAYVQPTTGNPYTGFATVAQVVARILTRGFNDDTHRLEIYVFAGFNGKNEVANSAAGFFGHANIDQSIFTVDEGETYQECKVLLTELLNDMGLSIFQENGKWYIVPRHREATATGFSMKVFDGDGAIVRTETVTNIRTTIGDISGATMSSLFHCNENQTLSTRRSVDTFALEHLSEFVDQIIDNPTITNDGSTAPNWTIEVGINGDTVVDVGVLGAIMKGRISNNLISIPVFISDKYQLRKDQAFEINLATTIIDPIHYWPVEITLDDSNIVNRVYYYTGTEWITDPGGAFSKSRVYLDSQNENSVTFNIDVSPVPADGLIQIRMCEPLFLTGDHTVNSGVIVSLCELKPVAGILEGRKRVFKKTAPKRERVKDNEVIRWNTHDDLSLKNVFFESDEITRIESIKNYGGIFPFDTDQLLYYLAFARALATQEKAIIFSGSVYGEVPFLGAKNYLGIADNMMVIEYRYDTQKNITFLKCIQLEQDLTLAGTIENLPIYASGIKPTIVG